ncbi:hypothetical protein BH09SUM1_BH09SUM1_08820 [soil metagenome]
MRENKRIREAQFWRAGTTLAIFLAINAVLRFALIPLNSAEYTDGILQLTQFANQTGVYPPLYTCFTWPIAFLIGPLWAGRLVSAAFSTAAVVPIFLLAQRSFGNRAAMFSALVYTVAPASLRWAPRVMTESTFCFFFWFCCERLITAQGARVKEEVDKALVWANILGALAALTRYQGIFLGGPAIAIALWHWRENKFISWKGLASLGFYLAVPIWSTITNTIHGTQMVDRIGDNALMTFILNAEPFLLLMPYFLTYPVTIIMFFGMAKARARPRHQLQPLTLYVFIVLLVLQSLFGSFQERYFLPLFGLLYIWAGVGMAVLDHRFRNRGHERLRPYVPILICVWSAFIAFLVLVGQRQAWGDFRWASEEAGRLARTTNARLFTNEIYRPESEGGQKRVHLFPMPFLDDTMEPSFVVSTPAQKAIVSNKADFFARMNVFYLDDQYYTDKQPLRAGDLLIMSDAYGGPMQVEALSHLYQLEQAATFSSTITPIFPDIMAPPNTAQNPGAWLQRYQPQTFTTTIWRVTVARGR